MTKNQLKTVGLTTIALAMSLSNTQATEALFVHLAGGFSVASSALDNIQSITFSNDEMSVKPFGGDAGVYTLNNIAKITFGEMETTDVVTNSPVTYSDVIVYVTSAGVIVVESPEAIQSLTLFNVDGKILRSVASVALVETLCTT